MTSGDLRRFVERCHAGPGRLDAWLLDLAPAVGAVVGVREGVLLAVGTSADVRGEWAWGPAEVILPGFSRGLGQLTGESRQRAFSTFLVARLSHLFGRSRMTGNPAFDAVLGALGYIDAIGIQAGEGPLRLWVTIPITERDARSHREPLLHRVRRHLQSGFMAIRAPWTADVIADPAGRVLHDGGSRPDARTRELLRLAAHAHDAERRGQVPDADAERVWRELLAGGWSLVEVVDTDGKRMLLLRRDPDAPAAHALDARERLVLARIARGASYKAIAFELGVGVSTASDVASRALSKLGFATRIDFARAVGPPREA